VKEVKEGREEMKEGWMKGAEGAEGREVVEEGRG
jgi:hypothetical protein